LPQARHDPRVPGRLDGKVALISGAARGQGAAEVRLFAAEGAKVVAGDVLDDDGAALAKELGHDVVFRHLDVTDPDDWAAAVDEATSRFGALDVLVSNAGISLPRTPVHKMAFDDYRRVVEVNQFGTFHGLQAAVPAMLRAGGGSVVCIGSVNSKLGAAGIAGYVSSKFAVAGIVKVAALELAPRGVRVNLVCPGPIDTPMVGPEAWNGFDFRPQLASSVPMNRLGTPDEVAELVCWLASDASAYCTGAEFVIDGGYLAGPIENLR
jgi:3alpha(or 20beta)-hydroxysteroid dehydrogenase